MSTRDTLPLAAPLLLLLGACSGTPQNTALQQAHAAYAADTQNQAVATASSQDLQKAKIYLDSADSARANGAEPAEINHRAYLVMQQLKIADENANLQRITAQYRATPRALALSGNVFFATGETMIAPGTDETLGKLVTFLQQNPDQRVQIEGYTDSQGSEAMNQGLSERRAEAVRNALVARGIDASRIETHGLGDASPVANNDTAAGRQQNRRAAVRVSNLATDRSGSSYPPPAQDPGR